MARTLLESELDRLYKKLWHFQLRGMISSAIRRPVAYLLKAVTLGAGIAIASGKLKDYDASLGLACSVAFTLDLVFSNLRRLLGVVAAGYAAKDQALRISTEYNRKSGELQNRRKNREISDIDFAKFEGELQAKTLEQLGAAVQKIQKDLHALDIDALKSLAIDSKDKIH